MKMKAKALFHLLLLFIIPLFGIATPQPRCVSVLSNGDVSLSWSVASGFSGTFNSYEIYWSNNFNGPYSLLTTIANINQTSYTHIGANANAAKKYYFIRTSSTSVGIVYSTPTDTVSSIKLTVTNPANGTAVLNWNPIATPAMSGTAGTYTVFCEYPSGVWTVKKTTPLTNCIDTIEACNNTINYRVEISDVSGCISTSSIDGGLFQNLIVAPSPVIDTLSVDDNNNATMSWNVSSHKDVEGYVVYRFNGSTWVPIDTVWGINNVNYTYQLSSADLASEQYRLAALDSCGNISPMGVVKATIFVTAKADLCTRSAILTWNDYGSLGTGIKGYNIYKSTVSAAGPYTLSGSVAATSLTYTESGLPPNQSYYYKIEAVDNSGLKTTSSNRLQFFSAAPIPPKFSYIRFVSVKDPNQISISCHVDVAASTKSYKIARSTSGLAGSYEVIATFPKTNLSPITYTDTKVDVDRNNYYYKMICVDSCGYDGYESNISKTILLNVVADENELKNKLYWNDYEFWDGTVASYNIYRGIDGVFDPAPIANVPFSSAGINEFIDDVNLQIDGEGLFNYYVEAIEAGGNTYGFSETSLSNIAEAYQEPRVFIPNAFKPFAAANNIFIPVTSYVNFKEYEFAIFNRWGQNVFESKDVTIGWDGTYAGHKVEPGVYVYYIKFKSARGEYFERKGSVTLLR